MSFLEKLSKVEVPNPRGSDYDIKVMDKNNQTFMIHKKTFVDLGLQSMGLSQMINPDKSDTNVYILVEDGDSAKFFKNNNRGTSKKNKFKNIQLYNSLETRYPNIEDGDEFILAPVEDKLFKIIKAEEEEEVEIDDSEEIEQEPILDEKEEESPPETIEDDWMGEEEETPKQEPEEKEKESEEKELDSLKVDSIVLDDHEELTTKEYSEEDIEDELY